MSYWFPRLLRTGLSSDTAHNILSCLCFRELLSLRESVSKAKETVTNLRQENENGVKLSRRDAACQYEKGDVKWH